MVGRGHEKDNSEFASSGRNVVDIVRSGKQIGEREDGVGCQEISNDNERPKVGLTTFDCAFHILSISDKPNCDIVFLAILVSDNSNFENLFGSTHPNSCNLNVAYCKGARHVDRLRCDVCPCEC